MSFTDWVKSAFMFVAMLCLFTLPLVFIAAIFFPPLWGIVLIQALFLMVGLRKA